MNVYFISCTSPDLSISCTSPDLSTVWVKVGKAKTPSDRVIGMQIGCPMKLTLIGAIPCRTDMHALWLEKELHKNLGWPHARGEWFIAPEDYEKQIQRIIARETPAAVTGKGFKKKDIEQTLADAELAKGDSLWLTEDELASLTGKKQHAFQIQSLEGMNPRPIFHVRHHDQFPLVQRWQFRT